MRRRVLFGLGFAAALVGAKDARAALTSSERAQIVSYVAEGRVPTADRVRALVARPDLSADESAEVMSASLAPVAFTEGRAAYLHEMLYGPASMPSRGVVAVAIARGLVSRADAIFARHDADLDQDAGAAAELVRLYAFLDRDVANAGSPRGPAHDPTVGIPDASYDAAAHALADHVARHPRWLGGDARIPAACASVRAQLEVALVDMTGDSPSRRVDAASALALTGPRRATFVEGGLLVLDDGHTDAPRIEALRAAASVFPGARGEVEGVALVELKPPVVARGAVVQGKAPTSPFADDPAAPALDLLTVSVAQALAHAEARRALEMRADLRTQATKDVGGDPLEPVAAEAARLGLDAATAVDRAVGRALGGSEGALPLLSDALGVLAAFGAPGRGGLTVPVGSAHEGGVSLASATAVRLAPAGFATSFTLGGHAWTLPRDGSPPTRDGAAASSNVLDRARTPATAGTTWSSEGLAFARLAGAPRASVTAAHVHVDGNRGAYDAIATAAPGEDLVVDAQLELKGAGAVLVRALGSATGFDAVGVTVDTTTTPPRASVRTFHAGGNTQLGDAITVPAAARYSVHLVLKGAKLQVRVGNEALEATVPAAFARGDVGLLAIDGASVDAAGWSVKRP